MEGTELTPRKAQITESSLVSIGLVIILVGAVAYVVQGFGQITENTHRIIRLEDHQEKYDASIKNVENSLIEIKAKLHVRGKDERSGTP